VIVSQTQLTGPKSKPFLEDIELKKIEMYINLKFGICTVHINGFLLKRDSFIKYYLGLLPEKM